MKPYTVKDIQAGSFFSKPIYLDEQFVLATPEIPFSNELTELLMEWDFREVYSEGEPKDESFAQNADIARAAEPGYDH